MKFKAIHKHQRSVINYDFLKNIRKLYRRRFILIYVLKKIPNTQLILYQVRNTQLSLYKSLNKQFILIYIKLNSPRYSLPEYYMLSFSLETFKYIINHYNITLALKDTLDIYKRLLSSLTGKKRLLKKLLNVSNNQRLFDKILHNKSFFINLLISILYNIKPNLDSIVPINVFFNKLTLPNQQLILRKLNYVVEQTIVRFKFITFPFLITYLSMTSFKDNLYFKWFSNLLVFIIVNALNNKPLTHYLCSLFRKKKYNIYYTTHNINSLLIYEEFSCNISYIKNVYIVRYAVRYLKSSFIDYLDFIKEQLLKYKNYIKNLHMGLLFSIDEQTEDKILYFPLQNRIKDLNFSLIKENYKSFELYEHYNPEFHIRHTLVLKFQLIGNKKLKLSPYTRFTILEHNEIYITYQDELFPT